MHLEFLGFQATAAAAVGTAATAFTGDSLNVKNARDGSKIRLITAFSKNQTLGAMQIVAPSFNDTTRGIRWVGAAAQVMLPLMGFMPQMLQPQELLSATIIGTAVAGDIEQGILGVWYDDSPGLNGSYLTPAQVREQGVRSVTVQASVTATAAGSWTGAELLTADSDLLRANTRYALVGGQAGIQVTAIGIRAPDWSNVRVAIPGDVNMGDISQGWFAKLSEWNNMPLIPVFDSANKNNIFIDIGDDENGVATTVNLNLVELPRA